MKILTTLFIMLLLTSCGKLSKDHVDISEPRPIVTDDITFKPYKEHFENIVKQQTGSINFAVGDIPIILVDKKLLDRDDVIGVCYGYADNKKLIEIGRNYWNQASKVARIALINHELGHCRLNRDHVDTVQNGVKLSIMHSQIVDDYNYHTFEDFYEYELVTRDVKPLSDRLSKIFSY